MNWIIYISRKNLAEKQSIICMCKNIQILIFYIQDLFIYIYLGFFGVRVSLCNSHHCPRTRSTEQDGLELTEI